MTPLLQRSERLTKQSWLRPLRTKPLRQRMEKPSKLSKSGSLPPPIRKRLMRLPTLRQRGCGRSCMSDSWSSRQRRLKRRSRRRKRRIRWRTQRPKRCVSRSKSPRLRRRLPSTTPILHGGRPRKPQSSGRRWRRSGNGGSAHRREGGQERIADRKAAELKSAADVARRAASAAVVREKARAEARANLRAAIEERRQAVNVCARDESQAVGRRRGGHTAGCSEWGGKHRRAHEAQGGCAGCRERGTQA